MKHIVRILILAVTLVMGLTTVSAQTPSIQVFVTQRANVLPTTVTNYLEDPFQYFNVDFLLLDAGTQGVDIYFDAKITVNTSDFCAYTRPNSIPAEFIHLNPGSNFMKTSMLKTQLRNGRLMTEGVDLKNPLSSQQLPEGTYQLCLDIYLWEERNNPNHQPISTGDCPTFDLCFSGSAPELVSPMTGAHTALNGAMMVTPEKKVKFFWTPVISNCADRGTRFKYRLKVVKVLNGQNYQDAINYNPTVFSTEVRNTNYAIIDTLRDLKVQMENGALYVAQVQAEQIKTNRVKATFIIANDGNSQPLPFYWGGDGDNQDFFIIDNEDDEEGDESDESAGLTQWEGGVEEESGLETIMDEMQEPYLVPNPKRRYVESDGYYTLPVTDDIEVGYKAAKHESLKNSVCSIALYENVDGDIDSITAREPLFTEQIGEVADEDLVSRTLAGWGAKLKQGELYYLELSNHFTVNYWNYSIADTNFYVNEMLAEHIHDTVSRDFVEEDLTQTDGFLFQWGNNPEAPAVTAPQWKAPVDRTDADIYDPANGEVPASVPEVKKVKTFPVSWTPFKDVAKGDEVAYEVNVYELKPGQTMEEAISENKVLVSRTVTDANEIPETDTKFFKVFSPSKSYVMTLSTEVSGEGSYHFENGNAALPIVIRVVK